MYAQGFIPEHPLKPIQYLNKELLVIIDIIVINAPKASELENINLSVFWRY